MPRIETILSVFVASPSDVSEERDLLESAINELNRTLPGRTGVRLELLRWEHGTWPSFGKDAQAVINTQIPQDYDIFIGILWNTIGSPTNQAESGTIEEFNLAKERYDKDPDSVHLMLYFKISPPLSMESFDGSQYEKVQNFQSRVKEEGAFFWQFHSADDFANDIRTHLTNVVYSRTDDHRGDVQLDSTDGESVSGPSGCSDDTIFASDSDDGILELEDVFEREMVALSAVLGRMEGSITDIGDTMRKETQEIKSLDITRDGKNLSAHDRQKLRADARRILKRTSNEMDGFVARMKDELPLFRQHIDGGIGTLTRAVPIYLEINEDRTELKELIGTMLNAMDGMVVSMEGFRGSVQGLPRLSTALVRAKRETVKVLQEVIDITQGGRASLDEVLSLIP